MLTADAIWNTPLPHCGHSSRTRLLLRLALTVLQGRLETVEGLERLAAAHDPFIVALNHSERAEAILLPSLFRWSRDGKPIHFLADWNFLLVPGIASLFRRGEVIPVCRKPARPRMLTHLRPLLVRGPHGLPAARARLEAGSSIGVFPEGTVNRDPTSVLAGSHGTVRLALDSGVSVIPVGVTYRRLITAGVPRQMMSLRIAEPLSWRGIPTSRTTVRDAHVTLMETIAALSGRTWKPHQRANANHSVVCHVTQGRKSHA